MNSSDRGCVAREYHSKLRRGKESVNKADAWSLEGKAMLSYRCSISAPSVLWTGSIFGGLTGEVCTVQP